MSQPLGYIYVCDHSDKMSKKFNGIFPQYLIFWSSTSRFRTVLNVYCFPFKITFHIILFCVIQLVINSWTHFIFCFSAAQINNFTISVDGQDCGRIGDPSLTSGESITITCGEPLSGTTLEIAKESVEVLGLAEVEPIFGCEYQCEV